MRPAETKIVSRAEISGIANNLRKQGKRIVFANGCFDILHAGHVRYLEGARGEGDALLVGVNADSGVQGWQGPGRPVLHERARALLVAALCVVDYVIIFPESNVERLLTELHPDVHAKGTDYTAETVPEKATAERLGVRVAIVGDAKNHSTSELATQVWTVDTRNWSNVRGIVARIRKHRFEAAIDYQGLWKSAAIPFLARIPRRIGFSSETIRESGVPILYTDRVKVSALRHVADQNGELSARTGARVSTGNVNLLIPPDDEKVVRARIAQDGTEEYIVLSPGGGWRSKCWPAERYGLLAQRILRQLGLRSVINVGPGEEGLAAKVADAAGDAQPIQFTGSLGQLMALLKNASAIVAGDTGPLHLADALRTRVVAIFGPTDPARNGPYRCSGVVLRWEGAATTYKRETAPDESLLHISVDEVMKAIRGLREAA